MQTVSTSHPHSRLWLIVTLSVVLISLAIAGYYLSSARKLKPSADSNRIVQEVTETATPTPTTTATSTISSTETPAATTLKEEVKQVDVSELKTTMDDLKTTLKAFQR